MYLLCVHIMYIHRIYITHKEAHKSDHVISRCLKAAFIISKKSVNHYLNCLFLEI